MAEWTGRKQRQHSPTDPEASQRHQDRDDTPQGPETPGAQFSPQHPGEVPDRSTVPGQYSTRVPRATSVRRPLTELGTAQAIMDVYAAPPGEEMEPSRFEQATATFEELRKAYPTEVPPVRPGPGYALQHGDAQASEMQAIEGASPVGETTEPAVATGEAYNARPGGGTGAPARTDAPAAEVGSAFSPSDAPASVRSPADALAGSGAATEPKRGRDDTGGTQVGESRWAAAARPGDASSPAGTLPAAKDGETNNEGSDAGSMPTTAPQ